MNQSRDEDEKKHRLSKMAAAAIAMGVSTSFFMNRGGDELLSKGLNSFRHALRETSEELGGRSFRSLKGEGFDYMRNYANSIVENTKKHLDDPIDLNTFSDDNIFNAIKTKLSLEKNIDKQAASIAKEEYFRSTLRTNISTVIDINNEKIEKRTNEIIDKLYTRSGDYITYYDKEKGKASPMQFSSSFQQLINDTYGEKSEDVTVSILEAVQEVDRNYLQHQESAKKRVAQTIEKLNDPDSYKHFSPKENSSFFGQLVDVLSGSRTATVNDVLEHKDSHLFKDLTMNINGDEIDLFDELEKMAKSNENFGNLVVDKALKIDISGEFKYYDDLRDLRDSADDYIFNQSAAKILKPLNSYRKISRQDAVTFISKGTIDYQLQAVAEGEYTGPLKDGYVRILGKTYKAGEKGLEHIADLDDSYMIRSDHGFEIRQFKDMVGDVDYSTRPKNRLFEILGIGDSPHASLGDTMNDKIFSRTRRSNYEATASNLSFVTTLGPDYADEELGEFYSYAKKLNRELNSQIDNLSPNAIKTLQENAEDEKVKQLLEITKHKGAMHDFINNIDEKQLSEIQNQDLKNLIYQFKNDSDIVHKKYISTRYGDNYSKRWPARGNKHTQVNTFYDEMQKEIVKESLLVAGVTKGKENVLQTIRESGLGAKDLAALNLSLNTAYFEKSLNIQGHSAVRKTLDQVIDTANEASKFFFGSDEFSRQFRETSEAISKKVALTKKHSDAVSQRISLETVSSNRPNKTIHLKKGAPKPHLNIIENINDQTKVKAYFKQFYAGRKNLQDVTRTSLVPYFTLNRLVGDLKGLNLNLAHQDTGSVLDLGKNIFLKRALPVYAGLYAASYLNDETRNFTGTSLSSAFVNSAANFKLGLKGVTDIFQGPLKDAYYWATPLNYISEGPYKNKKELKEHYEKGYDPVRKGRFWPIGGSEFFGGKISYFEPNITRTANVPWRDIGVYGSVDEKWKHSLMPTPRHPLSPLRYWMDPYWLEKKHKYDRPYPVSGPMFDPQTPWGIVGNATLGRTIKPRKRINKEFLRNDGVDIRAIIEDNNEWIRQKARSRFNTVVITGSDSAYEKDNLPANILLSPGKGAFGFSPGGTGLYGKTTNDAGMGTMPSLFGKGTSGYKDSQYKRAIPIPSYSPLSMSERVRIISASGRVDRTAILNEIESINTNIKMRARLSYGNDSNFAKEMISNNRITVEETLRDSNVQTQLRNVSNVSEMIDDAQYSLHELEGIYGFGLSLAFPEKKKRVWANASTMYAGTRRFWESGVEGMDKGGLMEIVRRFIPHEDRSRIQVNPLRNNMPSWMPSRFQYGKWIAVSKIYELTGNSLEPFLLTMHGDVA